MNPTKNCSISNKPRPWVVSDANDPLERLHDNALALVRSTGVWLDKARNNFSSQEGDVADLTLDVQLFESRYAAVTRHEGPEWRSLRAANPDVVSAGGIYGQSYVELGATLGSLVYAVLLEGSCDAVTRAKFDLYGDMRPLDPERVRGGWSIIRSKLCALPTFDPWLLEHQIKKEFARCAAAPNGIESASESALSDIEQEVLVVLLERRADSPNARVAAEVIARKAAGPGADVNTYKGPIAGLKRKGLVDSKEGRGGGSWLTRKGHAEAEQLARDTVTTKQ